MLRNHRMPTDGLPHREPFTTIDDCLASAQELTSRLTQLTEQKYPLKVQKGVKHMIQNKNEGIQLRAGARTYFLDIDITKEGKQYLKVTESRFQGEENKRERASIFIFAETAKEFAEAVMKMTEKLG
jgi:hypothetical protein